MAAYQMSAGSGPPTSTCASSCENGRTRCRRRGCRRTSASMMDQYPARLLRAHTGAHGPDGFQPSKLIGSVSCQLLHLMEPPGMSWCTGLPPPWWGNRLYYRSGSWCTLANKWAGSGALASSPDAAAAFRPREAQASSLGAINLGRHEFGRVGHSHLQGARKRQADHDEGAGQHTDRNQSAFAVALHNKGPPVG